MIEKSETSGIEPNCAGEGYKGGGSRAVGETFEHAQSARRGAGQIRALGVHTHEQASACGGGHSEQGPRVGLSTHRNGRRRAGETRLLDGDEVGDGR